MSLQKNCNLLRSLQGWKTFSVFSTLDQVPTYVILPAQIKGEYYPIYVHQFGHQRRKVGSQMWVLTFCSFEVISQNADSSCQNQGQQMLCTEHFLVLGISLWVSRSENSTNQRHVIDQKSIHQNSEEIPERKMRRVDVFHDCDRKSIIFS